MSPHNTADQSPVKISINISQLYVVPFGYSSDHAAQATRDIIKYYYGLAEEEELITGVADAPDAGISNEM